MPPRRNSRAEICEGERLCAARRHHHDAHRPDADAGHRRSCRTKRRAGFAASSNCATPCAQTLRTQLDDSGAMRRCSMRAGQLNFSIRPFRLPFRRGQRERQPARLPWRPGCLPLLCSLEDYNDETKKAAKTAIFRERTIHQPKTAACGETAQDALVLTLNETGRADLARMEMLLRKPPEEFLPELKGMIYRNPQTERVGDGRPISLRRCACEAGGRTGGCGSESGLPGKRHRAGSGAAG